MLCIWIGHCRLSLFFQGGRVAEDAGCAWCGGGPAYGIGDDPLHVGMMVSGQSFMAGAEIEDLAATTAITAAAAEDFAAAEPAHEDQRFWRRNIEVFAVHLFVLDLDVLAEPL